VTDSGDKREVHIDVAPKAVWNALVSLGPQRWYFKLDVAGDFQPGGHIVWTVPGGGPVAEEADVLEAEPPRRLKLRTRYMFAPNLAEQPPHVVTWEIAPEDGGSRVTLAWEAGPVVNRMLDAEAQSLLHGLRLDVDPVAAAELARLAEIGEIEVRDVTPERVSDYQRFFDHDAFRDFPAWQFCYCMETHRTQDDEEWSVRTAADNRGDMSEMIGRGEVTGLLAYVDGKPVGWCNYGESTHLSGVMRKLSLEAFEQDGVGSLACFVIAAPYRGHGVATKLLDAALQRLKAKGLRAVEAYPRKEGDGSSAQDYYRGALPMYERAGFTKYRDAGRYLVVRKSLE
jgi:ribosomal protein S18 acetylase RimI-like enzyme/uncharacterized protein YndB with AHSA1/START domain